MDGENRVERENFEEGQGGLWGALESAGCEIAFSLSSRVDEALEQTRSVLAQSGLLLSDQDVADLSEGRKAALTQGNRLEFGAPPIAVLSEELASSPFLFQENVLDALAGAQDCFYRLRGDIDLSVTDEELACAIVRRFDEVEGDSEWFCSTEVADLALALDDAEPMLGGIVFGDIESAQKNACKGEWAQEKYVLACVQGELSQGEFSQGERPLVQGGFSQGGCALCECRIVDDEGVEHALRLDDWEYGEYAPGWDGERWGMDFD